MNISDIPLVSIVIPMYNSENTIERAIISCLKQEIDGDMEVIVVDDGSTDNSASIAKAVHDPRVKVILQNNKGAPTARNKGIDTASGCYIALLDADDYFLPGHLARACKKISKKNVSGTYSRIIVDRGKNLTFLKPPRGLNDSEHISEYLLCNRGFVQTSSLVLKAEVAKSIKYLESLKGGQDTDYAMRLYHHNHKLSFIETPGAVWIDNHDKNRVSAKVHYQNRIDWLENNRELFTRKAYLADYGWFVAKGMFRHNRKISATYYYFRAILNRCYSPKLSLVVFLQVFLSKNSYRVLSDYLAKIGIKP